MSVSNRVIQGGLCEITQEYKGSAHAGLDIVNKNYTLGYIVAHSAGTVVAYRNNCNGFEQGSYGNYVKIKHDNGYYTLYGHMAYNTVKVKTGDRVSAGQVLGYMGNTGYSFGGHLHWEVRTSNDVKIDPTPYLNADLPSGGSSGSSVDVFYKVKTQKHGWLPEVKNLEDYAGYEGSPITAVAIRVSKGSVKYRTSNVNQDFMSYVTGYDVDDFNNGYAGDGENPIDRLEVYYYTPDDVRPFKKAKYRVNDLPWQYDNETGNGQDGYAGVQGGNITKLEITIE